MPRGSAPQDPRPDRVIWVDSDTTKLGINPAAVGDMAIVLVDGQLSLVINTWSGRIELTAGMASFVAHQLDRTFPGIRERWCHEAEKVAAIAHPESVH